MISEPRFVVRRQIIEFGSLPSASKWLSSEDGSGGVQTFLQQLLSVAVLDDQQQYMVEVSQLTRFLDASEAQIMALVDVLEAVRPPNEVQGVVRRGADGRVPEAVDAHAMALFLFGQLYIRQSQTQFTMDVWPASPGDAAPSSTSPRAAAGECTSPGRRVPHNNSAHFQRQRSNQVVRKELQQHLRQHVALMAGYTEYLQRGAAQLLGLTLSVRLPGARGDSVSAAELDRLSLLLHPLVEGEPQAPPGEGCSPMEISVQPFSGMGLLSQHMPMFADGCTEIPLTVAAEWLAAHIVDDATLPASMVSSPTSAAAKGKWENLPPAGQCLRGGDVDVQGVVKSTVVRGEGEFPSGLLRVSDCHDSVLYALAPLQFASIYCCSDCTVVLGAVGRVVRIERCERVQLITAAARVIVSSCHDCIFYLGVNRAPLLTGDNRFIQMAPYNTQYERLAAHMESAGVTAEPNLWDQSVSLGRGEYRRATAPDNNSQQGAAPGGASSPTGSGSGSPGGPSGGLRGSTPPPVALLPPEEMLPFMIPFQGGHGHMCGGAASDALPRWAEDLGSLVGLDGGFSSPSSTPGSSAAIASGASASSTAPSPLRLPAAYEEAKEQKVQSVANLRAAVKSAVLDEGRKRELQSVIQSHFKEWLLSSGNMRQVYDLARMERENSNASGSG